MRRGAGRGGAGRGGAWWGGAGRGLARAACRRRGWIRRRRGRAGEEIEVGMGGSEIFLSATYIAKALVPVRGTNRD